MPADNRSVIAKTPDTNRASDASNQAGLDAERKMAFYLRRTFEHVRDVWVFNDLRLVRNGDAAQMDHLVLHRSGMVIIESKSTTGQIRVNHLGEWTRSSGGHEQGMESPIMQARLQAGFVRLLLLENDSRLLDGQLGGLLPKHFNTHWPVDVIVAVSDSGRISRGMEVPELMKADQVPGAVKEIVQRHKRGRYSLNPLNSDATYVLTPAEMGRVVAFLIKGHTPAGGPRPEAQGLPPQEVIERARQTHPNAYRPWTPADESRLAQLYRGGAAIADLCAEFGRQPGGIRMRLKKLGLCEAD
jgi:hypothetical protein